VCITLNGCHSTKNGSFINDLQQDNVKGLAKTIIAKTYLVNSETRVNTLIEKITDNFNRDGFVTQDSIIDVNKKQLTNSIFIYNNGRLKKIRTWLNGKQSGTSVFEESAEGYIIKVQDYDSQNRLVQYYSNIIQNSFGLLVSAYSFNVNGKMISYFENHYKGTQIISGFTKDAKGTMTYSFHTSLNEAQDPIIFSEDNIGRNSTKNTLNYIYTKFDKQKNWTEQICYINKKPFKITQRIISYYK
jgi:hypothetical protein